MPILLLFFALTSLRSLKGIMLITSFIIVLFSNYYFFPETRAGIILKVLIQNDIFFLLSIDGSINERLSAIIGPYYGLQKVIYYQIQLLDTMKPTCLQLYR